jgi:aerobic carbon-monoxide dehydrogenase medium subunit
MPSFALVAPGSEAEAVRAVAEAPPGVAVVLAGGTDLLVDLEERRVDPRIVVSLRRLPWKGHRWDERGLVVGSTEPLSALEEDPELCQRQPALHQAITAVGSPALREQATLGGNLGRSAPASDLTPVLLVLDAVAEVVGPTGTRSVPVDALLRASRETSLSHGELIRSIRFPEDRPVSSYLWQRVRPANDISQIGIAVAYSPADGQWRVALGGVPPRPRLVPEAARALSGEPPPPDAVAAAAERLTADPGVVGDRRASDEHRRRLAGVLLERAVARTTARTNGGP